MRISDWSSDMCSSDLELGRNPDPDRSAAILRGLPAFFDLDPSSVQGKPGRALVVTRARTLGHMLARELANCGYRAQLASEPFEALRLAVSEKPDIVLTSAVLDGMPGIEPQNGRASWRERRGRDG